MVRSVLLAGEGGGEASRCNSRSPVMFWNLYPGSVFVPLFASLTIPHTRA